MRNPYGEIFMVPGTKKFSLAGMIARLPVSMLAIGLISMLSQLRGSYWLAGAVAGVFTLTSAIVAPQISKRVDRYGQSKVLPVATAISAVAILLLLLCVRLQAPDWTLLIFAVLAGFTPSMSAMVRARWSEIYRGQPQLHTAFSFESVVDEVCFIIGPPASLGLSVLFFPEAGPLVAVVLLIIGVTFFVSQRATEPKIYPKQDENRHSVLTYPQLWVLMLLLLTMGAIAGTVDVASVAFAEKQGQPAAASIVLSVYAIGSCLAGLGFGMLKLKMPLTHLLFLAAIGTMLTAIPLIFTSTIFTLSFAVFFCGLFFAPSLIIAMTSIEQEVPPSQLTESITWLLTGLISGVALGAIISGWLIDRFDVQVGFSAALFCGVAALLLSVVNYRVKA